MKETNGNLPEELIRRAMDGDRQAFEEIYRAYEGRIHSYILGHLNDKSQADDVFQNTFLSVHENIKRLKDPNSFNRWIFTVAYNMCMDVNKAVTKHNKTHVSLDSQLTDDEGEGSSLGDQIEDTSIELPEQFAADQELQMKLAEELNHLSQKQRDCLVLYYFRRKSIKEIAEIYHTGENTIKTRKKDAVSALKRRLEKYKDMYSFAAVPMSKFLSAAAETGVVKSSFVAGSTVITGLAAGLVPGAAAVAVIGALGAGIAVYSANSDKDGYHDPGDAHLGLFDNFVREDDDPDTSRNSDAIVTESGAEIIFPEDDSANVYDYDSLPDESSIADMYAQTSVVESSDSSGESTDTDSKSEVEWINVPVTSDIVLTNNVAESVPLLEDGIQDFRMLRFYEIRYVKDENILRFVYEPLYSKPSDYTMLEPVLGMPVLQTVFENKFGEGYTAQNGTSTIGKVVIEEDSVIFEFDNINDDIPEMKNMFFEVLDTDQNEMSRIYLYNSDRTSMQDMTLNYFVISTYDKETGSDKNDLPSYYWNYDYEYDNQIEFNYIQEYEFSELHTKKLKSNTYKYVMHYYTNGAPRPFASSDGVYNFSNIAKGYSTYGLGMGESYVGAVDENGTMTIRNMNIPKLWLGILDETGNELADNYKQAPYEKIKKFTLDGYNGIELPYELYDDMLYAKVKINENGELTVTTFTDGDLELLWIPPDTHYDTLTLPDHLVGYWSDDTLKRLNADVIILGADSEGFVEQLENSSDPIAQAVLQKIRASQTAPAEDTSSESVPETSSAEEGAWIDEDSSAADTQPAVSASDSTANTDTAADSTAN